MKQRISRAAKKKQKKKTHISTHMNTFAFTVKSKDIYTFTLVTMFGNFRYQMALKVLVYNRNILGSTSGVFVQPPGSIREKKSKIFGNLRKFLGKLVKTSQLVLFIYQTKQLMAAWYFSSRVRIGISTFLCVILCSKVVVHVSILQVDFVCGIFRYVETS